MSFIPVVLSVSRSATRPSTSILRCRRLTTLSKKLLNDVQGISRARIRWERVLEASLFIVVIQFICPVLRRRYKTLEGCTPGGAVPLRSVLARGQNSRGFCIYSAHCLKSQFSLSLSVQTEGNGSLNDLFDVSYHHTVEPPRDDERGVRCSPSSAVMSSTRIFCVDGISSPLPHSHRQESLQSYSYPGPHL